jgi:hypothetical protein
VNPTEFAGNEAPTVQLNKSEDDPPDEQSAEEGSEDEESADRRGQPAESSYLEAASDDPSIEQDRDASDAANDTSEEAVGESTSDEQATEQPQADGADTEPYEEETEEEFPMDDVPESGSTLAPEQMELADPVIAEIEGGTKRRKKRRNTMRKNK